MRVMLSGLCVDKIAENQLGSYFAKEPLFRREKPSVYLAPKTQAAFALASELI